MCTKATCCMAVCLLLIPASMFVSTTLVAVEANDDEAALLAFKAAAVARDKSSALASWNGSTAGGHCSWEGVRCRGQGTHRRVVELSLPARGFTGILSSAIGNLSSLRILNLSYNGFSGNIPASLGRLRRLHTIDLRYNDLSGSLPANLSSCTSLMSMHLRRNSLSGRVPPELGNKLTNLRILNLGNNSFTGSIPPSLANLSRLNFLSIGLNYLEGTIPPPLGDIMGLRSLGLAYNDLSGEVPVSLYNFHCSRCNFRGTCSAVEFLPISVASSRTCKPLALQETSSLGTSPNHSPTSHRSRYSLSGKTCSVGMCLARWGAYEHCKFCTWTTTC